MKDPKRLLEDPGSELDVLLLESGLDESPPARVVDRTLVTLGVASAAVGLGVASAGAGAASMKATGTSGKPGIRKRSAEGSRPLRSRARKTNTVDVTAAKKIQSPKTT